MKFFHDVSICVDNVKEQNFRIQLNVLFWMSQMAWSCPNGTPDEVNNASRGMVLRGKEGHVQSRNGLDPNHNLALSERIQVDAR